jgi:hypothetical protein
VLTLAPTIYDNYRMNKQPISVTLSPDNLLWLKGRARAVAAGSMSEFLDLLVTRARCGQDTPKPHRSMKGTLTLDDPDLDIDTATAPAEMWQAWREKWDALMPEFDGAELTLPRSKAKAARIEHASAVAERRPAYGRRKSRG